MPSCDMCGAEDKLFRCVIEGAQLNVCKKCSSFGKISAAPQIVMRKGMGTYQSKPLISEKQIVQDIVQDYGKIIKERREKMGLTQEDFAKSLNEKESLLQKIESQKIEPSIALARKLEKLLKIKLVEQAEEEGSDLFEGKDKGAITIGDVIRIGRQKR